MKNKKGVMPEGMTFSGEPLDEARLLSLVRGERERAIGLDNDDEMNRNRELALEYYRGIMSDMPVAVEDDGSNLDTNRSSAVSTDLADCVETLLPNLLEPFTGGDDALTFRPMSEDDVEAAEQETDYLRQIIFERNNGFSTFYKWIKESLLCRTGVVKWHWEDAEYEEFEGEATGAELEGLAQAGFEVTELEVLDDAEPMLAKYRYQARKVVTPAHTSYKSFPSNDFAVHPDTDEMKDAPYCVMRSKPQIQDLIADGYDPATVRDLSNDHRDDEGVEFARDVSNDDDDNEDTMGDLRSVEVFEHYIRADFNDEGTPQIWRVITGNADKALLSIDQRPRIEFAALCPFPMMYRFHGNSVADKMMPWQRINTSLLRMGLDDGYFAVNRRPVVSMEDATEDTLDDLYVNEPGVPIRVRRAGAIGDYNTSGLQYDAFGTMEQIKTFGEQSSGVIRNGLGLNPDSLHDTKGGMEIQNNNAQKRVRLMARLMAEGGVKDLFLGVHDMERTHNTEQQTVELKGTWVPVSPSEWQRRTDMTIEIGVGSGGREMDIQARMMIAAKTSELVEAQGGMNGPLITPVEIHAQFLDLGKRLGLKQMGRYVVDPTRQPPQQEEEGPDPEMAKLQMETQKFQAQHQLDQQKAQAQIALDHQKAQAANEQQREAAALALQLQREKAAEEIRLAREKHGAEVGLAREKMAIEAELAALKGANDVSIASNRPGGRLDQ